MAGFWDGGAVLRALVAAREAAGDLVDAQRLREAIEKMTDKAGEGTGVAGCCAQRAQRKCLGRTR